MLAAVATLASQRATLWVHRRLETSTGPVVQSNTSADLDRRLVPDLQANLIGMKVVHSGCMFDGERMWGRCSCGIGGLVILALVIVSPESCVEALRGHYLVLDWLRKDVCLLS